MEPMAYNGGISLVIPPKKKKNLCISLLVIRYVTSGQVAYIEKHMKDGAQTAAALRDLVDVYQLFIVGKGGRRNTTITTGISDWEECPELGNVGDLLASSEFDSSCSVLVIQQYRPPTD